MTVAVFGYPILDFLQLYFSIFSLVLVLIEKIYQTLKTVLDHISKYLKFSQKLLHHASYFELSSWCLETWSNTVFRV